MLMLLSGTKYHILREIGTRIGSPIRDKTIPLIITLFSKNDMHDYVNKMKDIFGNKEDTKWKHLENFLISFSGGHARTIETIANYVHDNFENLSVKYDEFVDQVKIRTISIIVDKILRSDYESTLLNLQKSTMFANVMDWIERGTGNSMQLGERQRGQNEIDDKEIERLVFKLTTLGFLVINGSDRYYMTSYFHLITFLRTVKSEYAIFLNEVMTNKFFSLLVGHHVGLGYTFENILLASLIVKPDFIAK